MSLRQAFRAKFRSEKDKDGSHSAMGSSVEPSPSSSPKITREPPDASKGDGDRFVEEEDMLECDETVLGPDGALGLFHDVEEKHVYELQLTQLQEQLVAAAIENQHLSDELTAFKEKNHLERILADLEFERQRNAELSRQVAEATVLRQRRSKSVDSESGGWVDLADEATEEAEEAIEAPRAQLSRKQRLIERFIQMYYELMSDFTEDADHEGEEEKEEDPLTVKKLKDNIKRFRNGAKPIFNTFKGFYRLLTWRTPSLTLTVFLVYMYSVWHGWLLPVILSLFIVRLFLNYLKHRGWNINIALLAEVEDEDKNKDSEEFKELGMSDKFNLVVQVAKTVQNTLGKLADNLEKIKNLLMWHQPDATLRLFLFLWLGLILSCLVPGPMLFMVGGLYMGFKMFILEYIYNRFPRFKQRHDSTHRMWKKLPTDAQLEKRFQQAAIDRNVLQIELNEETVSRPPSTSSENSDFRTFCDLFSLPATEVPMQGWRGGRRCALVNKDKSLTAGFKHGKLYLTRSFLCFERSKTSSSKNVVIPLADIVKLEKAKPYSWMPGSGMAMEVTVTGNDKPFLFIAILNRDEVFDNVVAYGVKAGLAWALEITTVLPEEGAKSPSSPVAKPPTSLITSQDSS